MPARKPWSGVQTDAYGTGRTQRKGDRRGRPQRRRGGEVHRTMRDQEGPCRATRRCSNQDGRNKKKTREGRPSTTRGTSSVTNVPGTNGGGESWRWGRRAPPWPHPPSIPQFSSLFFSARSIPPPPQGRKRVGEAAPPVAQRPRGRYRWRMRDHLPPRVAARRASSSSIVETVPGTTRCQWRISLLEQPRHTCIEGEETKK